MDKAGFDRNPFALNPLHAAEAVIPAITENNYAVFRKDGSAASQVNVTFIGESRNSPVASHQRAGFFHLKY